MSDNGTSLKIAEITDHAFNRAKERLGWNATTIMRMAGKALNDGVAHADTRGRLNRYLSMLYLTHRTGNNTRIYGEHVYVFHDNLLITVLNLPHRLKRSAKASSEKQG